MNGLFEHMMQTDGPRMAADTLEKMGRMGVDGRKDNHLVHVNDREMRMLEAMTPGGGGVNPNTGRREFAAGADWVSDWYSRYQTGVTNAESGMWNQDRLTQYNDALLNEKIQRLDQFGQSDLQDIYDYFKTKPGQSYQNVTDAASRRNIQIDTSELYRPPEPVQWGWDNMTDWQKRRVTDSMGYSGDYTSPEFWRYVGQGRRGVFENAVQNGGRYGSPTDVQNTWNTLSDNQKRRVASAVGWNGSPEDIYFNEFVQRNNLGSAFEQAVRNHNNLAQIPSATYQPTTASQSTTPQQSQQPSQQQATTGNYYTQPGGSTSSQNLPSPYGGSSGASSSQSQPSLSTTQHTPSYSYIEPPLAFQPVQQTGAPPISFFQAMMQPAPTMSFASPSYTRLDPSRSFL